MVRKVILVRHGMQCIVTSRNRRSLNVELDFIEMARNKERRNPNIYQEVNALNLPKNEDARSPLSDAQQSKSKFSTDPAQYWVRSGTMYLCFSRRYESNEIRMPTEIDYPSDSIRTFVKISISLQNLWQIKVPYQCARTWDWNVKLQIRSSIQFNKMIHCIRDIYDLLGYLVCLLAESISWYSQNIRGIRKSLDPKL